MKTLLVVDDDPTVRRFVRAALERRGWVVLEAEDGVDGVARAMLHQPDVIVTDISMPKSDGIEMLQILQQEGRLNDVRIVVISGVLDLTDAIKQRTNADVLLRKPFSLKDLYVAVGDTNAAE